MATYADWHAAHPGEELPDCPCCADAELEAWEAELHGMAQSFAEAGLAVRVDPPFVWPVESLRDVLAGWIDASARRRTSALHCYGAFLAAARSSD